MYYVIKFLEKKVIDIAEFEEEKDVLKNIKGFRTMENCTDFQDTEENGVLIIEGETLTIGLRSI